MALCDGEGAITAAAPEEAPQLEELKKSFHRLLEYRFHFSCNVGAGTATAGQRGRQSGRNAAGIPRNNPPPPRHCWSQIHTELERRHNEQQSYSVTIMQGNVSSGNHRAPHPGTVGEEARAGAHFL